MHVIGFEWNYEISMKSWYFQKVAVVDPGGPQGAMAPQTVDKIFLHT